MGSVVRRKFTNEFRLEAVGLAEQLGSVAEAARSLGIKDSILYNWKNKLKVSGVHAFPGKGKLKPEDEELRQLRREISRLNEENNILKKAAAYFATHSK